MTRLEMLEKMYELHLTGDERATEELLHALPDLLSIAGKAQLFRRKWDGEDLEDEVEIPEEILESDDPCYGPEYCAMCGLEEALDKFENDESLLLKYPDDNRNPCKEIDLPPRFDLPSKN